MLTKWNLVDEEKVANNPPEIRVCNCFLHVPIKYSQKTDTVMNKFKSDLLKLAEKKSETVVTFFLTYMLFAVMMLFLDLLIQAPGMKDRI